MAVPTIFSGMPSKKDHFTEYTKRKIVRRKTDTRVYRNLYETLQQTLIITCNYIYTEHTQIIGKCV